MVLPGEHSIDLKAKKHPGYLGLLMSLKSTETIVFRGVIYIDHLEAIGLLFHNVVTED